ncbi:hypothetical protein [Actinomadura gamaensis]|uniref:Uncharacterized protein n=1 Tax=Actinomadura gamaensis TaxID=1763541 RepID=A0ABV9U3E5_9ACTN
MKPEDVPAEYVDTLADILDDDAHEGCGADGTPCPGNVLPYYQNVARVALAEILPQHEKQIRALVRAETTAVHDAA